MAFERRLKLDEETYQNEEVLSLLVERVYVEPNKKNRETLFNALKDSQIYIPARVTLPEEMIVGGNSGVKYTIEEINAASRIHPEIMVKKKTGEKVMCWYTREFEMAKRLEDKEFSFVRMPVMKAIAMCEDVPEGFNIILDFYNHPVLLSVDELLAGLNGEDSFGDEAEEDD